MGMVDQFTDSCVLPGCSTPVADPTQPCDECLTACGPWLRPTTDKTLTAEIVADRDRGVHVAYAEQLRTQMASKAQRAADTAVAIASGEPERKPMQRCWLCEERRTCTRIDGRWECATCQSIS